MEVGDLFIPAALSSNRKYPPLLASTLALITPDQRILDSDRKMWHMITLETFQKGYYSEQDEIKAHARLTGATVKDSYLALFNRYQLNILGSKPGKVSEELEQIILSWLWQRPEGIGYLGNPLHLPPAEHPAQIDRWLRSIEVLAHSFAGWAKIAQPAITWLWEQQKEPGYWDFGARPPSSTYLPLSDNWRKKGSRWFDWTTRVLILLRKYIEGNPTGS